MPINRTDLQVAPKRYWQTARLPRQGWHDLVQVVTVGELLISTREIGCLPYIFLWSKQICYSTVLCLGHIPVALNIVLKYIL